MTGPVILLALLTGLYLFLLWLRVDRLEDRISAMEDGRIVDSAAEHPETTP